VAVAVLVGVRLASPHPDALPASPTTPFASEGFVVPFTADVPGWAASQGPVHYERRLYWQQDQCWSSCPSGHDVKVMVLAPQVAYGPGADRSVISSSGGYLAHLEALQAAHLVTLSGAHTTVVDGHSATVLDVAVSTGVAGALGCDDAGSFESDPAACWSLVGGTVMRLAVIDADTRPYYGSGRVTPPLLVLLRTNAGNDKQPAYAADLDRMLTTMRIPAPPAPTFTSSGFPTPFSIVLPTWTATADSRVSATGRLLVWQSPCEATTSDCSHPAQTFGVLATGPTASVGAASGLPSLGVDPVPGVTILDAFSLVSVDGHPTQVATFRADRDAPNSLGCEALDGTCVGLYAGTTTRAAWITLAQSQPPLLVWQSWTTGASGTDAAAADFDKALASLRFTS
jgi:hypothetical protein